MLLTPYLAFQQSPAADFLYDDVFAYMCHQKISRSYCLFQDAENLHVADCTPQNGIYREDSRAEKMALHAGVTGYKFPVSARDMFIYIGMAVGGIAVFLMRKTDSKKIPDVLWLVIALVPIGMDGVTQTVLGFRESTNMIRAITGFIAGFAVSVYAIPILNRIFGRRGKK